MQEQQPLIVVTFERGNKGDVVGHTDHSNKICFAHRYGLQAKPGDVWGCRVLRDTDPSSRRKGALIVELVTQHHVAYEITWTDVESVRGHKRPCGVTAVSRGIATYIKVADAPAEIAEQYAAALAVYAEQLEARKAEMRAEIDQLIAAGTVPQHTVLGAHASNNGTHEITVQVGYGLPYTYAPPALAPLPSLTGIDRARFLLRTFGLPSTCWRNWDGAITLSWTPYQATVPANELFREYKTLGDTVRCVFHLDGLVLGNIQVGHGPYDGRWGRYQTWLGAAEQEYVRDLIAGMPMPANWYAPARAAVVEAHKAAKEYSEQAAAVQWELSWVDSEYTTDEYLSEDEKGLRQDTIRSRRVTAQSENGTWTLGLSETVKPYESNWEVLVRTLRARTKLRAQEAIKDARKKLGGRATEAGFADVGSAHTGEYAELLSEIARAEELLEKPELFAPVDATAVRDAVDRTQRRDLRDPLKGGAEDPVRTAWAVRIMEESIQQADVYFATGVVSENATVEVLDMVARYTAKKWQAQITQWNRKGFRDVVPPRVPRYVNGSNNRPSRKECLEIIAHNEEAAREGEVTYNKWLGKSQDHG